MLTKDDLKNIRGVVREEVVGETNDLKNRLEAEMKLSRMRLEESIGNLTNRVKNIEIKLTTVEKSNGQILKDVKKIRKDLDTNIKLSDKMEIYLDKRVRIIEKKLGLDTPEYAIS